MMSTDDGCDIRAFVTVGRTLGPLKKPALEAQSTSAVQLAQKFFQPFCMLIIRNLGPFPDVGVQPFKRSLPPIAMRFRAIAAFTPAPGVLHELPLGQGDEVELVNTAAPDGWVVVKHCGNKISGLVPQSFLVPTEGDGEGEEAIDAPSAAAAASTAPADTAPAAAAAATTDADESARSMRLRALYDEWESKRVALCDFKPDAGSVFEMPMLAGDVLDLAEVKWPGVLCHAKNISPRRATCSTARLLALISSYSSAHATHASSPSASIPRTVPSGWITVKKSGTGVSGGALVGLVPETCVTMLPEPTEALPSLEEQKDAAERALKAAKEEKEASERALKEREKQLEDEREHKETAEKAERQRVQELKEAHEREAELGEKLANLAHLELREAELMNEVEILKQGGDEATLLELEVKRELRRIVQVRTAEFAKEQEAQEKKEVARKSLEADQSEKKAALEAALEEKEAADKAFRAADEQLKIAQFEREQASARLNEANRRVREAQERLRDDTDEGGARAATERVLHELIPGVKTLLNPDAEEVKKLTDTVPQALLRLAEEAAQAKLEAIRLSEMPPPEQLARKGVERSLFGNMNMPTLEEGTAPSAAPSAAPSKAASRPESRQSGRSSTRAQALEEQRINALEASTGLDLDGDGDVGLEGNAMSFRSNMKASSQRVSPQQVQPPPPALTGVHASGSVAPLQRPMLDDIIDVSGGSMGGGAPGAPAEALQPPPHLFSQAPHGHQPQGAHMHSGGAHRPPPAFYPAPQQASSMDALHGHQVARSGGVELPLRPLQQHQIQQPLGVAGRRPSKALLQPQVPQAFFTDPQAQQQQQQQQQSTTPSTGGGRAWEQVDAWSYPGAVTMQPPHSGYDHNAASHVGAGGLAAVQQQQQQRRMEEHRRSGLARSVSYDMMQHGGGAVMEGAARVSTAHANAQQKRSMNAHARRLSAARQFRVGELPGGWQVGRFYGPRDENARQRGPLGFAVTHRAPPPPPTQQRTRAQQQQQQQAPLIEAGTPPTVPPTDMNALGALAPALAAPPSTSERFAPAPAFGASSARFM